MVYAYLRAQFKQSGNGLIQLILTYILSFLLLFLFKTGCYICGCAAHGLWLYKQLALPSLYSTLLERPWTIITYAFIHKGFLDLFWDSLLLYLFGQNIRSVHRSKHILRLYGLGQLAGAMVFGVLYQFSPPFRGIAVDLMGPSAAIYAIMVAVCVWMPRVSLYCFFFALPLRYVAIALLVIALIHLPTQQAGDYLAQWGGAVAGYVYARFCKHDLDSHPTFVRLHRLRSTKRSATITQQ